MDHLHERLRRVEEYAAAATFWPFNIMYSSSAAQSFASWRVDRTWDLRIPLGATNARHPFLCVSMNAIFTHVGKGCVTACAIPCTEGNSENDNGQCFAHVMQANVSISGDIWSSHGAQGGIRTHTPCGGGF